MVLLQGGLLDRQPPGKYAIVWIGLHREAIVRHLQTGCAMGRRRSDRL
jgi:hypothetical protein